MTGRWSTWNGIKWVPVDFRLQVWVPGWVHAQPLVWDGSKWCDVWPVGGG